MNDNGTLEWTIQSFVPFPTEDMTGGIMTWVTTSTITVSPCQCRDPTNVINIVKQGGTVDITVSGINGLQTGSSEAANTWYSLYVIADTTGVEPTAFLLIPEGTAFSQSGYDKLRRIGFLRNNASSNLLQFSSSHNGIDRYINYEETRTNLLILNQGGGSVTFVTQSCATVFPPGTSMCDIHCEFDLDNDGDKLYLRSGDSTPSVAETPIRWGGGIVTVAFEENDFVQSNLKLSIGTPSFQWATSVAGNDVHFTAIGYWLHL